MPFRRISSESYERHARLAATPGAGAASAVRESRAVPHKREPPRRWSVSEYHAAFRVRRTTPYNVASALLGALPRLERELGTIFTEVHREAVLQQALQSEERWVKGKPLSIWDGVPIAVKEMIDVEGHVTGGGSWRGAGVNCNDATLAVPCPSRASTDDPMVARMRSAGAIIIGVTSMTEYGVTPLGWSAHAQGPRNPFRTGHFSGGSSSGSAVAVAVGLVPMAIGFDGGGSIRIPAALSGVVGLAATFGRIEYHAGAIVSMIKAGPLAATVADAALSYVWLAGGSDPLSGDATRLPSHTTSHGYGVDGPPQAHIHGWEQVSELSGMRIGLFPEWYDDAVPEVREQVHAAVHRLEALGVEVVQIRIPNMLALSLSHGITISSEFSWEHDRKFSDGWPLEPSTVIQLVLGRAISAVEVHAANRLRSWSMELIGGLFKEHRLDSIVTPTVGRTAPPLPPGAMSDGTSDTSVVVDLMKHIFLANLLGLPAISVPVGLGRETELPCAIQLIGEWWEEAKLLRLANALGADSEGGALPRPPHFFSELDALLLDVGVAERTP